MIYLNGRESDESHLGVAGTGEASADLENGHMEHDEWIKADVAYIFKCISANILVHCSSQWA